LPIGRLKAGGWAGSSWVSSSWVGRLRLRLSWRLVVIAGRLGGSGPAQELGRKAFFFFLIISKGFSIFVFSLYIYAKRLYVTKYIYCLHLSNRMGSPKYIFGFPII
jgi:hypothetical protein